MKGVFLFFIMTITVINAEVEVFVDDHQIFLDDATMRRMDVSRFSIYKDEIENHVVYPDVNYTSSPRNFVEDAIKNGLEVFREYIPVGYPSRGIPPLDPFYYDNMSFKFVEPYLFKATLSLNDNWITGLEKFITENVVFKILGLKLDLDLKIPELNYVSDFDVKGRITLVIPFRFGGGVRLKIKNLKLGGRAALSTTIDGYLKLRYLYLDFVAEKTTIHFTGIIGDGPLNSIVNWLLNFFTDDVIKAQITYLGEFIADALFNVLNEILGKIKLSDILG